MSFHGVHLVYLQIILLIIASCLFKQNTAQILLNRDNNHIPEHHDYRHHNHRHHKPNGVIPFTPSYPFYPEYDYYGKKNKDKCASLYWNVVYNCDFNYHDCGVWNQANMGSTFMHRNITGEPFHGKTGMMYLDIPSAKSCGARLITRYFPTNDCRFACLTLEYIMYGDAPKNIFIVQQEKRNYCISEIDNRNEQRWVNTSVTIDLSFGSPRFFVEAHFNRSPYYGSSIAIGDISFRYGKCHYSDPDYVRNQCSLNTNQHNQH